MVSKQPGGSGLTSLTAGIGSDLGFIETNWRPRRIAIAGVRFASGAESLAGGDDAAAKAAADKAAADKTAADAKAAADEAAKGGGKTAEQIAADKKTADDKAAADKKAADDAAAKEAAAKNGKGKEGEQPKAPDKYELTVPENARELVGEDDLKFLEEVARANDWTNEEAQAELETRLSLAETRLNAQRERWLNETKADKDYGGAALEESTRLARLAVSKLRPDGHARREAFTRFLNRGGAGDNIEVVSFLADLGKLFDEDSPNLGKGGKNREDEVKSTPDVLFPSSKAGDAKS